MEKPALCQVVTVLAVLYSDWRSVTVPELNILFYMTGMMTGFSGLHYLVTARLHD
jgi:hypothetical protein